MKALLIDISTILRWHRASVGTIRVQIELLKDAERRQLEVQFCRFDPDIKKHIRVSDNEVWRKVSSIEQFSEESANAHLPRISGKCALQTMARRLSNFATFHWRGAKYHIHRFCSQYYIHKVIKTVIVCLRQLEVDWSKGCTYISLGADWDDNDLDVLGRRKKAFGFTCVGICYDLIPIKFPDMSLKRTAERFHKHITSMANVYDLVICISQSTEKDLKDFLRNEGEEEPQTEVIILGSNIAGINPTFDDSVSSLSSDVKKSDGTKRVKNLSERKFVLYVSTIEARKNHKLLLDVWSLLIASGYQVPALVFVGMWGWGVDQIRQDIESLNLDDENVVVLHNVSDSELSTLYRNCLFTVYPSFYEGWGLPVAESLFFGKYCLTSDQGSLPEVGQGFVSYLDPRDAEDWFRKVKECILDPSFVVEKNRYIAQNYVPSSWETTFLGVWEWVESKNID